MNVSNSYWAPDVTFEKVIQTKPLLDRTLGFHFDLPWPLPATAGAYSGEGAIPGRRELSFATTQSEYFATDNIVPSSGGVPLVNIYAPHFKFKRSDRVIRV